MPIYTSHFCPIGRYRITQDNDDRACQGKQARPPRSQGGVHTMVLLDRHAVKKEERAYGSMLTLIPFILRFALPFCTSAFASGGA